MKAFVAKIEAIWMAVAFAEEGQWETAVKLLESAGRRDVREPAPPKRPVLRA